MDSGEDAKPNVRRTGEQKVLDLASDDGYWRSSALTLLSERMQLHWVQHGHPTNRNKQSSPSRGIFPPNAPANESLSPTTWSGRRVIAVSVVDAADFKPFHGSSHHSGVRYVSIFVIYYFQLVGLITWRPRKIAVLVSLLCV